MSSATTGAGTDAGTGQQASVRAVGLVRPLWQRGRLWLGLVGLVLLAAALVALTRPLPRPPLDPGSASKNGSKAVVQLLAQRGTSVQRITALDEAGTGTILVAAPDAYRPEQLLALSRRGARLVLIAPDRDLAPALDPRLRVINTSLDGGTVDPGCSDPGAQAAGPTAFASGALQYGGLPTCYQGRAVLADEIVVLGTDSVLRNDSLGDEGAAALAINAISDDGSVRAVQWLLPGPDAGGGPSPSVWNLFPDHSRSVLFWLIGVGLLLALWRGRRLGPPVTEPLPVVVRSAEIVEGHGRLYERAGARDRAAAALRTATAHRLSARLGLPRNAGPAEVRQALDPSVDTAALFSGVPADDAALIRLAVDLDGLENLATSERATRARAAASHHGKGAE